MMIILLPPDINWSCEKDVREKVRPIDCTGRLIPLEMIYYPDKPISDTEKTYLRELFRNPHYYRLKMGNSGYLALECRLCNAYKGKGPQEINSSHTPNSNMHKSSLLCAGQYKLKIDLNSCEKEEAERLPPREHYSEIMFGRNVCISFSGLNLAEWLRPKWFPQWYEQRNSRCISQFGGSVSGRLCSFR